MKTPFELINSFSTKMYSKYKNDPAKMLIQTGVLGWTLSAAAQIGAVVINKEIPDKQKKFLIPQEMADAAINILTFFAFTTSCNNITKHLLKSGKLSTKPIREFLNKNIRKEDIGKFTTNIETNPKFGEISEKYSDFRDGVQVVVNIAASVIAGNILTPILRNVVGAKVQKQLLHESKQDREQIIQNPSVPAPLNLPAQNRFGIEDYKKKTSGAPLFMPSGSMRV